MALLNVHFWSWEGGDKYKDLKKMTTGRMKNLILNLIKLKNWSISKKKTNKVGKIKHFCRNWIIKLIKNGKKVIDLWLNNKVS